MQVPFALSLFCLRLRWSGLESTPTGYCSAWISPTLSVDCFDTQNLPVAVNRDPGVLPFSVPTLGCGVTGLLFPELSCLPLDSLGVTCYCRDMWQNRTPQTACMGPMPMGLHILQFGILLTLLVRFSRGPRVEQVGTLNDLCLKNESCRSNLNCEKEPWHGCCLGTMQDYSLNAIRMCTFSLKTHLQWRALSSCSHLPCLSRAPDALQAAGQHFIISWVWLHIGRNCFLPVFKMRLLHKAAQWCLCGMWNFPFRNVSGPKAPCFCKLFSMTPG